MKKTIIIAVAFLIGIFVAYVSWNNAVEPPTNDDSTVRFVVQKGKGATQIANDLYDEDLIKNPLAFKFYVQLTGRSKAIGAGEFEIARNLSMYEVLDALSGNPLELWVTIPEGLRKEEIVLRFIKGLEIASDKKDEFRDSFLANATEGYMFPDTYLFPRTVTGDIVATRMKELFEEKTASLQKGIDESDLSLGEIITLASIVERETKTDKERPVVAGILLNRLNAGMALQADATAQYAIANARCSVLIENCNWWTTPTLDDLGVNSPYNTYKFAGLPPGPISNPGYTSIEAAVNPVSTDYFYYIHEDDGTIHYAKTLDQHNANVSKYLR